MPCPVCQGATSRLSGKHEYWIRACQGCSHQYAEILPAKNHVESIYSDEYFQDGTLATTTTSVKRHFSGLMGNRMGDCWRVRWSREQFWMLERLPVSSCRDLSILDGECRARSSPDSVSCGRSILDAIPEIRKAVVD